MENLFSIECESMEDLMGVLDDGESYIMTDLIVVHSFP